MLNTITRAWLSVAQIILTEGDCLDDDIMVAGIHSVFSSSQHHPKEYIFSPKETKEANLFSFVKIAVTIVFH